MAQLAGLSESHFSRLFRQVAEQSPRVLLRESYVSQAKIAEMLGFGDAYFFNRQFTQSHGVSPGRLPKAIDRSYFAYLP